jgi:hypothetical protein
MNDTMTLRQIKDGQIFVELNAVLQKYLGKPSEKLVQKICKIVELVFDAAYNYEYILEDASEYNCSHIAGKKRIKQYDEKLFIEIDGIFHKYLYELSHSPGVAICRIIEIILNMYGYKQKSTK